MTTRSMFYSAFGAVGAGMVIGAFIGLLLGWLSPQLIDLFMGNDFKGDPIKTGLALGILNGAIFGFFAGGIIVIASAIVNRTKDNS